MLKALALLARRGDALIVPSAVAPTATEPGACSSPRLPPWCTPGVLSTMVLGHGRCGCGFWRRSRAADSRCRSAGEICATGDRVVPWADDPTRIASSKRPPPPARQTRPASAEYVAQLAKAPAFTERLQRPPRRRRRPRFTRVVGVHGSANHGVATPAPPLATGPPHYHHITATRTTPAHTHPYRTHLHLDCTHQRTHVTACHTQPASTPMPVPQLTPFSCLRAALARQDLLAAHRGRRDPWFVLPAS